MSKEYEKLGGLKPVQYAKEHGPIQFFVTKQEGDTFVYYEATAILHQSARVYPAIMKNPKGHCLEGRRVNNDEVEKLGLERFEFEELQEQGWDYIPLVDIDLTGEETGRVAYAIEQQLQLMVHDVLSLGFERLNRFPGAGNWNNPGGNYIVGMLFPPKGFNKLFKNDKIVAVNGIMDFRIPRKFKGTLDGIQAAFV